MRGENQGNPELLIKKTKDLTLNTPKTYVNIIQKIFFQINIRILFIKFVIQKLMKFKY